jgi:hypothetical protein
MSPYSRRSWVLFFLVLSGLGLAALTIPIVYNLSLQLRPGQLAAARQRWRSKAPADYDLKVLERITHGTEEEDNEYFVAVRGGRPVLMGCNGEVLFVDPALAWMLGLAILTVPQEDPRAHDVEGMFDHIEETLKKDVSLGGRNYCTAAFDANDGHPQRFVHRVRGTRERLEWIVRLEKPDSP